MLQETRKMMSVIGCSARRGRNKSECLPPIRQPPPAHPTNKLPVLHLEAVTSCPASTARARWAWLEGYRPMVEQAMKRWEGKKLGCKAPENFLQLPPAIPVCPLPTYRWLSQGAQAPNEEVGGTMHVGLPTLTPVDRSSTIFIMH